MYSLLGTPDMNSKITIVVIAAIAVMVGIAACMLYNPADQNEKIKEEIEVGDYYQMSTAIDDRVESKMTVCGFVEDYYVSLDDVIGGVEDKVQFKGEVVDCIRFTDKDGNICYVNADSGFIYKMIKNNDGPQTINSVKDTNLDTELVPGDKVPPVGTFVIIECVEPTLVYTTHFEVESVVGGTIFAKTSISYSTDSFRYQATSVEDGKIGFLVNSLNLEGDRDYFLQAINYESFPKYLKNAVKTDERNERIETAFGIKNTTVYTFDIEIDEGHYKDHRTYDVWVGKDGIIYMVEYRLTLSESDEEGDYSQCEISSEIYKLSETSLFV